MKDTLGLILIGFALLFALTMWIGLALIKGVNKYV